MENSSAKWAIGSRTARHRDVQSTAAVALARSGDVKQANKLAADLAKTFPLDTLVQKYWLPTIRAALAIERKKPGQAIEQLKPADRVEMGAPISFVMALYPAYLRGEAYLMRHDGAAAAAEFSKFIDHRGLVGNFPLGALARLGLARAYALQGEKGKARTAYEDFLTLWKDGDAETPILKQAKAEYAKL